MTTRKATDLDALDEPPRQSMGPSATADAADLDRSTMSRFLWVFALTAAVLPGAVAPRAAGPCDHLKPNTYAYVECMNEHRFG
ncbi:hypothetical protein FHR81_005533 [Actinoalloteichus hoggarensis]|uniref:Uncharacterized protein n=2 Tax=Actinoalloteichus hoggarensis TaxID=1470176 RepID=A0A221W4C9_9PSEU|nr:hypothetical protein AHOG_15360 [Actinoalloteichus hoggarensis]MBB5924448.1 hypothetical protein [Actinoalloteichus hoggarensis]